MNCDIMDNAQMENQSSERNHSQHNSMLCFAEQSKHECDETSYYFHQTTGDGSLILSAGISNLDLLYFHHHASLVDIVVAYYDPRKSDKDHSIPVTIHLKLWLLRQDEGPKLKDCQTISCQQEDLQPDKRKLLDVPLKNISRQPLDDLISFSQSFHYMRIGHCLYLNKNPKVSSSFEALLEDREISKICQGRLAYRGSYLISAQTKALPSSKDTFNRPVCFNRIYQATEIGAQYHCKATDKNTPINSDSEIKSKLVLFICNLCGLASKDCYRCAICDCDLCTTCLQTGGWCKEKEHTIYQRTSERPIVNEQKLEIMVFGSFYGQRLQILDTRTNSAKTQEMFCRHSGTMIDSCPIIHPSKSIVFWLIGSGQLLVGNLSTNFHAVQTIMQSAKTRCISADLQVSSCGCYLHIISLEVLLEEERSHHIPKTHDQPQNHICYASYRMDEQEDSIIKLLLASVTRFEMAGAKGYSEPPSYAVTWSPTEAYVTYIDTTLQLRIYKLELFSMIIKATLEKSAMSGFYGGQAAYRSGHISLLRQDLHLPLSSLNTVRYLPGTKKHEKPRLIVSDYPGSIANRPVEIYWEDIPFGEWTDVEELVNPLKALTTPPAIQANSMTGNLEADGSLPVSKDSFLDHDDPIVPFPNVLCEYCLRVCYHSRLLNDPTLWVDPSSKEKTSLDKKRTGFLFENLPHYSSTIDVKVSSSRGCHLCTLLLPILLKEKPRRLGAAILSEASMALLQKKAAEITVGPYNSIETATNLHESLFAEENLRLIQNFFPNARDDTARGLNNYPWYCFPSASPLLVRISLTDPPVRDGKMKIYEPTGCQSPFVLSELTLKSHRQTRPCYPTESYSHWSPHGDPARLTKSTESEPTFKLARHWINTCLMEHGVCCIDSDLPFDPPTRVIDVGPPDGSHDPRLYATGKKDRNMRYMTLSHCWGGADILTLTDDFHDYLTCGMPMTALPQTFQDAVKICRRLDNRYLWIDSLCIDQDDPKDWDREAPRMRSIYQNAYCTIAALGGENSFKGCFDQRQHPCELPARIGFGAYESEGSSRQHEEPLHGRAWVLQERLLSPRTLLFGRSGISWECQTCKANEQYPDSVPMDKFPNDTFKLKEVFCYLRKPYGQSATGEKAKNLFSRAWHEIVKAYCCLALTFPADKLIAFSGIADEVQRCTGLTYYYGLWVNPSQPAMFLSELL